MALKTYSGSCHCGAVRYEADIDLTKGTTRCNCSICAKARSCFVVVPPDHFRLTAGAQEQTEYEWVPPERPGTNLHYRFCRTCGILTVGRGDRGPGGRPFYFVSLASLSDADKDELAASVGYVDGKHARFFDPPPEDIRAI